MSHALVSSPFDRVAQVRVKRRQGTVIGSGYLVSDHLLLTAGHVVRPGGRLPKRVEVEFLSGIESTGEPAWCGSGGLDAALVQIDDPPATPDGVRLSPVRWGRLTGQRTGIRAGATGFPRVMQTIGGVRVPHNVSGKINPGSALGERYDLNVRSARPARGQAPGSSWSGLSGASLFANDERLLLGVLVIDRPEFAGRVLTAVPAWRLLEDGGFARSVGLDGCPKYCESLELTRLFTSPLRRRSTLSPARLLGAEAEVVPFRGRESVLRELSDWCREESDFEARVLTGPGGQGKTRLAMELMRRMRADGWVTGFVQPAAPSDVHRLVPESCVPLLLVVDYAETRTDQLEQLVRATWDGRPQTRVRLLLIARTEAEWWERLRRKQRDALESAGVKKLPPLEGDTADRIDAYRQAVGAFADRLAHETSPAWRARGADPDIPPLEEPRYASVLTLHMTALGSLLQRGYTPVDERDAERPEDLLLAHERRYWEDAAAQRGLEPDEHTLRLAVASAALLGARTRKEAAATLALVPGLCDVPEATRGTVADWVHNLYPVSDGRYWGPLQPDTLGERLIQLVGDEEEGLVEALLDRASDSQRELALAIVARIAARLHHLERDERAAQVWYRRAAGHGHAETAYQLGWMSRSQGNRADAEHWWSIAADSGHLDAAFHLAQMLEESERSDDARVWFEKAARGGHLDAAFRLGESSGGTDAERWYELAAKQGHKHAAYNLGWLLKDRGRSDLAIEWWDKAAREMREAAAALADELMSRSDVSGARHWYEVAAQKGWNSARVAMGRLALKDNDLDAAASWLEPADREGDVEATVLLAEVRWRQRTGDQVQALYEKAWNGGHNYAGYQLGCWWWERGDRDAARDWWRKAAGKGEENAVNRLAQEFHEVARARLTEVV